MNLSKELGTRHRAAVGMSEKFDSLSLVVSEETGSISIAIDGKLQRHLVPEQLEKFCAQNFFVHDLDEERPDMDSSPSFFENLPGQASWFREEEKMRKWITQHDVLTKLLSIVAAFILWSYFMGAQNPTRTLEYKDIAVQLTGVDQLYNNYNLKIIEGADATGGRQSVRFHKSAGNTYRFTN